MTSGTKTTRSRKVEEEEATESATEQATTTTAAKKAASKTPAKSKAAPKKASKKTASDDDEEIDDDVELDDSDIEDAADDDSGDDAAESSTGATDKKGDDDEDDEDGTTKPAFSEPLPTGAIVISSSDEDDVPVYSTQITGATADPAKDYLKQIGKVPLLNAAEEVELAMRIEAGLFAEEKLSHMSASEKSSQLGLDLQWVARDGQRAKSHLLGANLRLVVSLAKRYTGRGMQFLDLIQEGNLGLIRAVEKFDYTKRAPSVSRCTWSRSSTSSPVCSGRCCRTSDASPRPRSSRASWT